MSAPRSESSASEEKDARQTEEHFGLVHAVAGTPGSRRRLAVFSLAGISFLVTIFGTALFDLSHYDHEESHRIFAKTDVAPTTERILDGKWIRFFESQVSDASFARRHATVLWSQALYRHLRVMSKGFKRGEGDWVFHAPRNVRHRLASPEGIESFARECRDLSAKLAERGTRLHIALVPRKGLVAYEHLGPLKLEAPGVEREILDALRRNGVSAPDLVTPLCSRPAEEVWLLQDTHWTPEGARRAAESLVQQVGLLGLRESRSLGQYPSTAPIKLTGDTITGSGLIDRSLHHKWDPPQSLKTSLYVLNGEKSVFNHNRQYEIRDQKVWLTGTSFSNCFGAFPRALEHYLGQPLGVFAAPAQGPYIGLERAIALAHARDRWPEHILWEIPAFYLAAQPLENIAPNLQVRRLASALTLDRAVDLANLRPGQTTTPSGTSPVPLSLSERRSGPWLGFIPTGASIVTDGRGMIRYHLQRKVATDAYQVRLIGKQFGQGVRWAKGSRILDVPVISAEPTVWHRLDIEITDAKAKSDLESVSLRLSCRFPEPGAFAELTRYKAGLLAEEVARHILQSSELVQETSALVLLDMGAKARPVEPLISHIVAHTDSGPVSVWEAQQTPLHSGRAILVSLAALAGRKVHGIELVASDPGRSFEGYWAAIAH